MEVWMRVSDSNSFLASNFYPSISAPNEDKEGLLTKMDRLLRSGSSMESAKQMYIKLVENEKQTTQKIVTRAYCEDRLACSIAFGSAFEFELWISSYARCLSSSGDADTLRFLVDVLLGIPPEDAEMSDKESRPMSCWWFNSITSSQCLGLDNKDIIRTLILPEMSKNRQLQRLTNELSMELES
jgi:protein HIRA/HIR1